MNKVYNPAIRQGKAVLISKDGKHIIEVSGEMQRPELWYDPSYPTRAKVRMSEGYINTDMKLEYTRDFALDKEGKAVPKIDDSELMEFASAVSLQSIPGVAVPVESQPTGEGQAELWAEVLETFIILQNPLDPKAITNHINTLQKQGYTISRNSAPQQQSTEEQLKENWENLLTEVPKIEGLTDEQKRQFIEHALESAGKILLFAYVAMELKVGLGCTIFNEPTGESFDLSFKNRAVNHEIPTTEPVFTKEEDI